jgi:hypothetical protein
LSLLEYRSFRVGHWEQVIIEPSRGRITHSIEQAGSTGFDGIDLRLRPSQAMEARGQFIAIERFALLGLDRAKGSAWNTPDRSVRERRNTTGAVQGAMLLSLGTIGREGVWE